VPESSKRSDFNPEGTEFLIQSPSPDWIRRKISLSDLWGSAVNLILEEANVNQKVQLNQLKSKSVPPFLDSKYFQQRLLNLTLSLNLKKFVAFLFRFGNIISNSRLYWGLTGLCISRSESRAIKGE
jgi:hypothetical protein